MVRVILSNFTLLLALCCLGIALGVARPKLRAVQIAATAALIALFSLLAAPLLAYLTLLFLSPLIADRLADPWPLVIAFAPATLPPLVYLWLTFRRVRDAGRQAETTTP